MVLPRRIEKIKQALHQPLPGWQMQKRMAPENRATDIDRMTMIADDHRESSVLLLLHPHRDDQLRFILIRRPEYEGVHSGQIALPGGARENNEALYMTALRETYEEIGVPAKNIILLGQLSPLYIPPSKFVVYPYVGYHPTRPVYKPDIREVAEIIESPLHLLTEESIRQFEFREFPRTGPAKVPFYNIFGHKVWGATAMMLAEFIAVLEDYFVGVQ